VIHGRIWGRSRVGGGSKPTGFVERVVVYHHAGGGSLAIGQARCFSEGGGGALLSQPGSVHAHLE